MGVQQFERGVGNQFLDDNVQVDIERNTSNQYDDDVTNTDISSYDTGEQNISGAKEVTIAVSENSGSGDANIKVEWTDGSGNVTYTETPSSIQSLNGSQDYANIIVKSTHFQVKGSGSSTDTDVTVNAH